MSEGELKQRIWKIPPEIQGLQGYPNLRTRYEHEIAKVLNEAKAEFPKPDEGWADGWVGENFDGDVLAWFKKWFGEVP